MRRAEHRQALVCGQENSRFDEMVRHCRHHAVEDGKRFADIESAYLLVVDEKAAVGLRVSTTILSRALICMRANQSTGAKP